MSSKQSSPIASQYRLCVSYFNKLSSLVKAAEHQSLFGISHTAVCGELGRFRIWAGNIGALQTIKLQSSLDYRLREAPKIFRQIVQLLDDLSESLQDGQSGFTFSAAYLIVSSLHDCFRRKRKSACG
jgi:hypothetical protein